MTLQSTTDEMSLPTGYHVRSAQLDDAEAVAHLETSVLQQMGYDEQGNAEDIRGRWQQPKFDLASSTRIVETDEGTVIGYAALYDESDPPVRNYLSVQVHPEHQGQGIEAFLFNWVETTAQRTLERAEADLQVALFGGAAVGFEAREAILRARGYEQVRTFYRMVIHMEEAPPEPQFAEGYSVRSIQYPDEVREMLITNHEGFKDHWGYVETDLEEVIAEAMHWIDTDPLFEAELHWVLIEDATGKMVGTCICRNEEFNDPKVAYVEALAVLPSARGKGNAKALLHHAFGVFWRRGRKSVALGVDATSLTGATQLYERVGMHKDQEWGTWRLILREGRDISTKAVGDQYQE